MPDKLKIFISTVSSQFKDCRDALSSDLQAIGCEVKVQENFQQGPDTLIAQIEAYVDQCDRVIALVGDAYGWEAAPLAVPATDPPRSYTQWEYFFALGERLDGTQAKAKERYVYFASPDYLTRHPVTEPAEYTERQRLFRQQLEASGKHRGAFDSIDQLCRLVLRDGWQMQQRPRKPCNLPYPTLGSLFKGRDEFMAGLHERLQRTAGKAAAIVAKQVIHGLGGVGKTRLAIEYAWRYREQYSALLFIKADGKAALEANLAALCDEHILDLPARTAAEQAIRVAAALRWLVEHDGWLLILDNVDTREAADAVSALLSQWHEGHVLMTSRLSDWSGEIDTLELDVLHEVEAAAFLLDRTQQKRMRSESDAADARQLAREMGGLALALEQAGAFIAQKKISLADYLIRWRAGEAKLRSWFDESLTHYPKSVAVTWDASFNQLDAQAKALLQMLCWFAPEPVPRALLTVPAAGELLAALVPLLDPKADPERAADVEDVITTLAGYSLVKWEDGNHAFAMHRLVAEITRERIEPEQRAVWLQAVLDWLNSYLPVDPPSDDVRSWGYWLPLKPHLFVLLNSADSVGIAKPTSRLLNDFSLLLKTQARWQEAEPLMRQALSIDEAYFGADHFSVAIRLNNLAQLLQETGRIEEAEPLLRRALAIDEANYDAEHTIVARGLNNLALMLLDTNRLEEAEPLMRRALAIDEVSFGVEHPNVAIHLNNLARLLHDTHRLEEAEPLMRRALVIDEAGFGADHPNVARDLNNLAQLFSATNRFEDAEPLMRRALMIDEASFGVDHPKVAVRLNNLAQLLQNTNRLEEAEPLMRRALTIDEASFGAEHPKIATRLNNLALLLMDTNRLEESEPTMRRSLEIILLYGMKSGFQFPKLNTFISNYRTLLLNMGLTEAEIKQKFDSLMESSGWVGSTG